MPGVARGLMRGPLASIALAGIAATFCFWNLYLISMLVYFMKGNDYCRMHNTAAAYWHGGDMYGWNIAVPAKFSDSTSINLWNMNPPHFHLVLLPFSLLSWQVGLTLWFIVGALCLVYTLHLIAKEVNYPLTARGREVGLVALLGFTGTTSVASTGQLTFFLFMPVTLAWIEARRVRWIRSGLYI